MNPICKVLMGRDRLSKEHAEEIIDQAKKQLHEYLDAGDEGSAYEICAEYFGLEPDYLIYLM